MIPKLYDKTGKTLLGELTNCIDCYVEEERNGTFSLTMTYPITDELHHHLIYDNIIRCRANDEQLDEPFRIYHTERIIKGTISIKALHQSFDLAYDFVANVSFENQSCEYALNSLFRESQFSKDYKGHSDIVNAQSFTASAKNIWEAIVGSSGSIIDTYGNGAEIKRSNKDIYVYNNRGTDRGVCIEYSVNMMDEALQVDTSELTTAMIGFANYYDENGEQRVIETGLIRSSLVDSYAHPFITRKDFTDRFENDTIPTIQDLETLVNKEFTINHVDVPKCSYIIDFIPLSKCAGYEDIQDEIHLCDTVNIKDYRYNIDTKAKVIKYTYNVLLERYDSMELGDPRNTLADIIAGSGGKGEKGEPGTPGEKGEDGNIGDFPDSLPDAPIVTLKAGLATIQIDWTYESQVYYNYEVYASTTQGFTPNVFDLIYKGQASSYLHSVSANTTWYYRVRAVNSHGNSTAFSEEVSITPGVIDADTIWIEKGAIGDAMIGELRLDRGWVGQLEGYWIDARNLSVTDGNGKRTLDIDSYGNVRLDVASLKISSNNVATQSYVDNAAGTAEQNAINNATGAINDKLESYYTKKEVESKFELLEDQITLNVTQEQIEEAVNSLTVGGTNLLLNSGPVDLTGLEGYNGTITLVSCSSAPYGYAVRCTANGSNALFGTNYPTYSINELVDGEEYTISGWARASSANTGAIGTSLMSHEDIELTTQFKYFTFTARVDKASSATSNNFIRARNGTTSGAWIEVHSIKLERGNFATAWSPSPRDIEGDLITLTERVSNAELKIKPDAIISTVTSSTEWSTQSNNITSATNTAKTANTNASNALSKANANANSITSLTQRVSTAELKITSDKIVSTVTSSTTYKDAMNGKVSTNKIISSINQTAESIKINASKIELSGAVSIGNSNGDKVRINNADYEIITGSTAKGFLGLRTLDDGYVSCRLALSSTGVKRASDNYIVIQPYNKNANPQSYPYPYVDIAYRCQGFAGDDGRSDVSNIKMYGDGVMRISPIKKLEITTNFSSGSYSGSGEKDIAQFGSSNSEYYPTYLDVRGCIRNHQSNHGLIISAKRTDGGNTFNARAVVYTDGFRTFAPVRFTTDNVPHYLGSGSHRWQTLYSVNSLNTSSDITLKENIKYLSDTPNTRAVKNKDLNIQDMYNFVRDELYLASYNFKKDEDKDEKLGFIAQDIVDTKVGEKIIVCNRDRDDTLGYDNGNFEAVLAGALQVAIKRIEELENRINELESKGE